MDRLRTPFFVAAIVCMVLVVLIEVGATAVLNRAPLLGAAASLTRSDLERIVPAEGDVRDAFEDLEDEEIQQILDQDRPPGLAISYMALVDGILLFTVALMGAGMVWREQIHGRIQGVITFIFGLLLAIGAVGLIFAAIGLVTLMVGLFLAAPFGTLTYLAIYGFFNRAGAGATLGLLMALKVGFGVCLLLAQQRFLQNRGLVLMFLTALLSSVVISFLHGLPPRFLVSITDGIAAIVVAVLAAIWALFLMFGSVGSVIKALRVRT